MENSDLIQCLQNDRFHFQVPFAYITETVNYLMDASFNYFSVFSTADWSAE